MFNWWRAGQTTASTSELRSHVWCQASLNMLKIDLNVGWVELERQICGVHDFYCLPAIPFGTVTKISTQFPDVFLKHRKTYFQISPRKKNAIYSSSNQGCGAGAQAILTSWSRSLEFGFRFHRHSLWGKRVIQIITMFFFWFFGPNCSGAGAKNF